MTVFKFGNWSVGSQGITWQGGGNIHCTVPLDSITNTGTRRNAIIYAWLVEIARDTRLSDEDIYCLNTAFVYALDFMLGVNLDVPQYALLAETFKEQQLMLTERKKNIHNLESVGIPKPGF